MSKILFSFERDMPTVSIIRDEFLNLTAGTGISSQFKHLMDITPQDINSCDVLFMIRPNDILSWKVANRARESGCFVVTFCDDDLLNLPQSSPTIPWRRKGLVKALNHSDAVCSSSRYVCEKYRQLTISKRYALLDTIVRPEEIIELADNKATSDVIKIVYAAAPSHVELFNKYVLPVIPVLASRYGKKLSFDFVSVRPNLLQFEDKIQVNYVKGMPLHAYRVYMREKQFDLGLAPLNDDEFSKCKYFNKFIEYTLHGTVGVYSRKEPYTYVIQDEINGFLADNTSEGWLSSLTKAIDNAVLRKNCLDNAKIMLRNEFTEEKIISKLIDQLPELSEYEGIRQKSKTYTFQKCCYLLSRPFDMLYLSWFYLKNKGISGFLDKLRTHRREASAYGRK